MIATPSSILAHLKPCHDSGACAEGGAAAIFIFLATTYFCVAAAVAALDPSHVSISSLAALTASPTKIWRAAAPDARALTWLGTGSMSMLGLDTFLPSPQPAADAADGEKANGLVLCVVVPLIVYALAINEAIDSLAATALFPRILACLAIASALLAAALAAGRLDGAGAPPRPERPHLCGVHIKRFLLRFSLGAWMTMLIVCTLAAYERHGHDYGVIFSVTAQFGYLIRTFAGERAYLTDSIDAREPLRLLGIGRRLVVIPTLYSLTVLLNVFHPSHLSSDVACSFFFLSQITSFATFVANEQKATFRASPILYGRYVTAAYSELGEPKIQYFLASGLWGCARHINYTFEILTFFSWALFANPGRNGPLTLAPTLYVTIFLTVRARSDEARCLAKYGDAYAELRQVVPSRILPLPSCCLPATNAAQGPNTNTSYVSADTLAMEDNNLWVSMVNSLGRVRAPVEPSTLPEGGGR